MKLADTVHTSIEYKFLHVTTSSPPHSKFWCRNRPGDEMKDKYNQFGNNPLAISEEVVDTGVCRNFIYSVARLHMILMTADSSS